MNEDTFKQYQLALELIAKQKEYINWLHDEVNSLISVAVIHGWKANNAMCGYKIKHEMLMIDIKLKDVFVG